MNHSKIELLKIRVFIYFLMISVGLEFVRGLAWWFWPRVFHEIQLDIGRGSRHLRAWLRLEGFLAKQLTWQQAGAGYCQVAPNPLLNFSAGLLQCPLLWKWAGPRLNDPRRQDVSHKVFCNWALEVTVCRFFHGLLVTWPSLSTVGVGYAAAWYKAASIPGIILEPGCHIREDWKEKFEDVERLNLKITEGMGRNLQAVRITNIKTSMQGPA